MSGASSGLTVKQILDICCFRNIPSQKICHAIPSPRENATFVIDLNKVSEMDLSCDDSGNYNSHSTPSAVVRAVSRNGKLLEVNIIHRGNKHSGGPMLQKKDVFVVNPN